LKCDGTLFYLNDIQISPHKNVNFPCTNAASSLFPMNMWVLCCANSLQRLVETRGLEIMDMENIRRNNFFRQLNEMLMVSEEYYLRLEGKFCENLEGCS